MKTKKMAIFSFLVLALISCLGCATTTGPRNEQEAFPLRNQDPRWGIIINEGTVHLNLFIYDEAGRLVEQGYVAGVSQYLTVNGQYMPRYWIRQLEIGNYRIEMFPFYYQTQIFPPARYRVDLPKQTNTIYVGRNPTAYYDYGYYNFGGTYRHWGWILRLNSGYIPETAHGLPGFKINLFGNF